MASRKKIEAYERKLAKIATEGKPLDADCLMSVATVYNPADQEEHTGTLVWFSQEIGPGLFGLQRIQSVRICPMCFHRRSDRCPPVEKLPVIRGAIVVRLERNTDGGE